jgi:hypothetical protein
MFSHVSAPPQFSLFKLTVKNGHLTFQSLVFNIKQFKVFAYGAMIILYPVPMILVLDVLGKLRVGGEESPLRTTPAFVRCMNPYTRVNWTFILVSSSVHPHRSIDDGLSVRGFHVVINILIQNIFQF